MKDNTVVLDHAQKKTETIEVKPVKVVLRVESDLSTLEYKARLRNIDSVNDLLNDAVKNDGFFYEKIAYTYGTELDNINRIKAPQQYKWRIFHDGNDITASFESVNLSDNDTYIIKLIKNTTHI